MSPRASNSQVAPAAWMRLPSGRRVNLLDPAPDSWTDQDLAKRLARCARWAGESIWPRAMSVAQHSLLVLAIRLQLAGGQLSVAEQRRELLHDAEEGLIGFDCIRPFKQCLGEPFERVSGVLSAAIATRYDLTPWNEVDKPLHKLADHLAAASEAVHIVGWSRVELHELLGIDLEPLAKDPLADVAATVGMQPWEPWPEVLAATLFEQRLQQLQRQDRLLLLPPGGDEDSVEANSEHYRERAA